MSLIGDIRRRTRSVAVRATAFAVLAAGVVVPGLLLTSTAQAAGPCDLPIANKVVCENSKAGNADWAINSQDDSIAGYTTDISATPGSQVNFKVKTDAPSYRIDIFRLGYYAGMGARKIATVNRNTPQSQPVNCLFDDTGLVDCGNWAVSASWTVPSDAVSGLYYAVLHRNDTGGENEIAFVVRDDTSTSKVLFQTSDSTWQAYNRYGGNSMYGGTGPGDAGSAYKVSYNRPVKDTGDENFIFNAEYPMLRFMEANGYDVSYTTNVDTARRGNLITNHQVFMAVGHDEYWSKEQRDNVEAARAAGVHLAFLTGNEIFWKTRWEPSKDGSAAWRTVVAYKETKANAKIDPSPEWTGTWRDPRFSPPSDGGKPENALLGQIFTVNGRRDDALSVPAAYGKMRLWRNTPLATMPSGSYSFRPGTLGYEWDTVEDNGFQPAGVAQMSRTTVTMDGQYILQNHGDLYASGTKTHALTLYRYQPSGALVFAAGTVQWAWGVEDEHAFQTDVPTSDVRIKQATVNILADMGVQPATLQAGLVAASASTDTALPTVAIGTTNPATVGIGYTVNGTVADTAGRVAGVEVSVDDGATWHSANWTAGTLTWNYAFTPANSGTRVVKVRAVDDSANLSTVVSRTITVLARDCPCSIWTDSTTPSNPATNDSSAVELGVKFQSGVAGYVRGVRFYKGTGNSGTHTGNLWSAGGELLATGTFTGESATGWQTLTFPTAVEIAANTTYVASYFAPNGRYAADSKYFTSATGLEPLTALQGTPGNVNGVYRGGSTGFPQESFQSTNYWVDVVFALDPGPDTRAPGVLSSSPQDTQGSYALNAPISIAYDEAISPSSAQITVNGPNGGVSGSISVSGNSKTVTFTPNSPWQASSTYYAAGTASDLSGNTPSPFNWSFTTGSTRPADCPCTVWDDFAKPVVPAVNDSAAVELGTKVRFDGRGQVLGVRFYKGFGNSGTHTGSLWTASGTRIGTGTFTGESTSGWQTLLFTTPVSVDPNTTYVVSYYAPNGRYSASGGYFGSAGADYGAMHALRDGVEGGNSVYRYGSGGGFPTGTYNATNYWVDVIWRSGANGDSTPPTVSAKAPAADATGVAVGSTVQATFNEPVDLSTAQFSVQDPGNAKLKGAVSLSGDAKTVIWTPTAPLAPSTRYTTSVKIADANGNPMVNATTWSFTTTSSYTCPCTLFSAATEPTVPNTNDGSAYELGVRFSSSVNGTVTGVRFYKGIQNTGTHTGSLWSASGQLLATGTFSGETASGWQNLTFATPVAVTAGTTYVASYTTTVGRYSSDSGYFQRTSVASSPLSAGSSPNGVYRGGSGFPGDSYGGANYWVDVVFGTP